MVANVGEIVACHPGQNTTANQGKEYDFDLKHGHFSFLIRNSYLLVCPEDGAFQYNTNVVFDRNGRFIARYETISILSE